MTNLNSLRRLAVPAALGLVLAMEVWTMTPTLAETEADRWNLADLYPDQEAWQQARESLDGKVDALEPLQGTLGQDASHLKQALDILFEINKAGGRLWSYASMLSDQDTRQSGPQGMKQQLQSQFATISAKTAWIDPEILEIPREKIEAFLAAEPGLAIYRRYLERLEKRRAHTLDKKSEQLLGMASMLTGDGNTIGSILRNAEIPWKTITLADGSELKVDVAGYSRGRASTNRLDRIKTFDAFFSELKAFEQTLATTLAATVKAHVFNARVRHYETTLDAALLSDEIDPAVYGMLVEEINNSLPALHRYLRLRARMLGVSDLGYHDLYPSLVGELDKDYSWATTQEAVFKAFEPLGKDYLAGLQKAIDGRWIDVYPRTGKRSGAYVNGSAYDVHPYMLLNHQDDYESASTFAHESGHLMHSMFSNATQPFPDADYETFVAEVASTTNEWLFFRYNLAHARDDHERLAILGKFLESIRTTVFRQTMFAEFELEMHRMGEQGKPITAASLDELYLRLLRKYYGDAKGVCHIDPIYAVEWAFIPHFHYDYYVYTYATSFIAGTAFVDQILSGEEGARRYIDKLLRAGSSKPPVEILKDAGVDMTTPAPIRTTIRRMNEVMDQMEEILDRISSSK